MRKKAPVNSEDKVKKDIISDRDFIKLNNPTRKSHSPLPDELLHEDENDDTLEETLIGMEYDLDPDGDNWDESDEVDLSLEDEVDIPNEPSHHPNP